MRIGTGAGPDGKHQHQSRHYVYDVRSGVIVCVHHFAGALPKSEVGRAREMVKGAHEASGIPVEHLAVLVDPEMPPGEGDLRIEHASCQLIRERASYDSRVRP